MAERKIFIPWWLAALAASILIIEALAFLSDGVPGWTLTFFTGVMAIATTVLVAAAILALRQISEARTSRYTLTATDFSRRWDEPTMVETRQLVRPFTDPVVLRDHIFDLVDNHPMDDTYLKMLRQPNYFEDLAILENGGAISYEFIRQSLGFLTVSLWDLWEPTAQEFWVRNKVDNYPAFRALAGNLKADPRPKS